MRDLVLVALDLVGAALAPPRCSACDAPVSLRAAFCAACASTVERVDSRPGDYAAFVYGGAIAEAVTRFKYGDRPDLARPLGDLLRGALGPHARELGGVVVVPVPLHASRLAERGYNQSVLLARRCFRGAHVPLAPCALRRVRDTPRQATLDRAARLENVQGAFVVTSEREIRGRDVLLVDDVVTTGSTLRGCAGALLVGGARSVRTAVLARAQ